MLVGSIMMFPLSFLILVICAFPYFSLFFLSSPEDMLIDFREIGVGRERDRERNISVREKLRMGCLLHVPQLGTTLAT